VRKTLHQALGPGRKPLIARPEEKRDAVALNDRAEILDRSPFFIFAHKSRTILFQPISFFREL